VLGQQRTQYQQRRLHNNLLPFVVPHTRTQTHTHTLSLPLLCIVYMRPLPPFPLFFLGNHFCFTISDTHAPTHKNTPPVKKNDMFYDFTFLFLLSSPLSSPPPPNTPFVRVFMCSLLLVDKQTTTRRTSFFVITKS
jgi:hypothetical protein